MARQIFDFICSNATTTTATTNSKSSDDDDDDLRNKLSQLDLFKFDFNEFLLQFKTDKCIVQEELLEASKQEVDFCHQFEVTNF